MEIKVIHTNLTRTHITLYSPVTSVFINGELGRLFHGDVNDAFWDFLVSKIHNDVENLM